MKTTAGSTYLLGYTTQPFTHYSREIHGSAKVAGNEIQHVISLCFSEGTLCDVGRNSEGELMWISEETTQKREARPTQPDAETQSFSFETIYDPPVATALSQATTDSEEQDKTPIVSRSRWEFVRTACRDKRIVFAVAGAGFVVAFATFVLVPRPDSTSEEVTAVPHASSTAFHKPVDPAQAAIDFIVSGRVEGYVLPEDNSVQDLHAEVISTSGEVVLVEVTQTQEGQLTKFATLLLQKTGTTWRIREVYDPQSY